jgi:maleylpyruvate isomerase
MSSPDLAPDRATDLGASLDEMAAATDRLLATVDRLTDADVRAPSGLPDWTRAHVLTHLARNADALGNLAWSARTGEPRDMYPGGVDARNAAIEAGAGRTQGDQRLDLNDAAERLLEAFADFPDEGLDREVGNGRGAVWLGFELPLIRTREVEIHHVDLLAGYTPDDWPADFVTRTLDQLGPSFVDRGDCPVGELRDPARAAWRVGTAGPVLTGPAPQLLAWLTGRSTGSGLSLQPPGSVPVAPRWS